MGDGLAHALETIKRVQSLNADGVEIALDRRGGRLLRVGRQRAMLLGSADSPLVRRQLTGGQAQERGLPRSVGADDADAFVVGDREVDALQQGGGGVGEADMGETDRRHDSSLA